MFLRTLFTVLALGAFKSSLGDDVGAYALDGALAADDACAGDDATCALNALQLRAQQQQEAVMAEAGAAREGEHGEKCIQGCSGPMRCFGKAITRCNEGGCHWKWCLPR
mmetsp:Transcript_106885/g.287785  ORF Transcript_106885/g.287785 Transcript_106885/m.287785 type:complete len:109 (-) Transcript_106885:237-563(-)